MKGRQFSRHFAVGLAATSVALAAIVEGTPGDDRLRGTMRADVIRALAGNDVVMRARATTSFAQGPTTTVSRATTAATRCSASRAA